MRLRPALLVMLLAACGAGPDDGPSQRHFSWRRVRVLVGDAETGRLSLFDAEDEEVTHRFEGGAPGALHASFTGDHALLVLPSGARLLSSGVSIWEHIDHVHVYKDTPRLRPEPVTDAATPVTGVHANDHYLLLTHPGGTDFERATLVHEARAGAPAPRELHRLPLPLPSGLLSLQRRPAAATLLPWPMADGDTAPASPWPVDEPGRPVELPGCMELRQAAGAGPRVALACAEGFLSLDVSTARTSFAAEPRARGARALLVHPNVAGWFARLEDDSLVHVDGASARPVRLPDGLCDLALDPGTGQTLIGLTRRGDVVALAPDGRHTAAVSAAVPAFDCAAPLRPRLGVAPERAYLTDPSAATLVDVDLRARRVAGRYPIGGRPGGIVVLGLDPRNASWRGPRPGEA